MSAPAPTTSLSPTEEVAAATAATTNRAARAPLSLPPEIAARIALLLPPRAAYLVLPAVCRAFRTAFRLAAVPAVAAFLDVDIESDYRAPNSRDHGRSTSSSSSNDHSAAVSDADGAGAPANSVAPSNTATHPATKAPTNITTTAPAPLSIVVTPLPEFQLARLPAPDNDEETASGPRRLTRRRRAVQVGAVASVSLPPAGADSSPAALERLAADFEADFLATFGRPLLLVPRVVSASGVMRTDRIRALVDALECPGPRAFQALHLTGIWFANPLLADGSSSANAAGSPHVRSYTERAARSLADVVTSCRDLVSLKVKANTIGDEGVAELAAALTQNSTLALLDISSNSISETGAIAVATMLASNSTLRFLNLG
ncbi:hypothetical protein HK405_014026, partial [Cladochytrium tenue]